MDVACSLVMRSACAAPCALTIPISWDGLSSPPVARSDGGSVMRGVLQACYGADGQDVAALRTRVLPALRRVVAFDSAFMAVCDPDTLLPIAAFSDDPLAAAAPLFLDNEYGGDADVNRFADLARAVDPVASLAHATRGDWA